MGGWLHRARRYKAKVYLARGSGGRKSKEHSTVSNESLVADGLLWDCGEGEVTCADRKAERTGRASLALSDKSVSRGLAGSGEHCLLPPTGRLVATHIVPAPRQDGHQCELPCCSLPSLPKGRSLLRA